MGCAKYWEWRWRRGFRRARPGGTRVQRRGAPDDDGVRGFRRVVVGLGVLGVIAAPMAVVGQMPPSWRGRVHHVEVGNPAIGRRLFREKGCIQCHAIKGKGGTVGPDLGRIQHTDNVYTMAAIMWNHAPRMTQVMQEKGVRRPEFRGDEMAHLLAYLHSLEVVGDPEKGKQLFVSKGCVQCHAIRGEGGKIGPDLGATTHPHPTFELVGAMWNHAPTMTAIMQGMGIERPIPEGNEMADLLAYLQQVQAAGPGPGRPAGDHHGHRHALAPHH